MRKILAALCLLSMTGCAQLSDAAGVVKDAVLAPPDGVITALHSIVNFVVFLLSQFVTTLFAPYLKILGL